jgi:4-hydroxybenzoate polyprenyltransferase
MGGRAMKVRDLVELTRAPAALSVPGDALAGAAAAGWPFGWRTAGVTASSVLLYWAGMALNDYADRDVDAKERPDRPIPSGRVRPGLALGLATGLTAAGIGAAGLAGGRRALAVALPLSATVWAYDLALKSTPAGPVAMAAARGLDVLLGAGAGGLRAAAPPAATIAAHTLAVTVLSRREVTGGDARLPAATLAATGAIGAAAARIAIPRPAPRRTSAGAAAGLLGCYLATFGRAQAAAVADPSAGRIRRAVGAGILALMPLQASLAARRSPLAVTGALAAAFPLARHLSRKVSPT